MINIGPDSVVISFILYDNKCYNFLSHDKKYRQKISNFNVKFGITSALQAAQFVLH